MDESSQASRTPMWPMPEWMKGSFSNPLDIFAAPQTLTQSILPGWIFGGTVNVTEANSNAPDTEHNIVARYSYGNQLGHILEALTVVIGELPKVERTAKAQHALSELLDLSRNIEEIKLQSSMKRLDQLATDLEALRDTKPEEYRELAAKIRSVIGSS
jgi:hypothetical protein